MGHVLLVMLLFTASELAEEVHVKGCASSEWDPVIVIHVS